MVGSIDLGNQYVHIYVVFKIPLSLCTGRRVKKRTEKKETQHSLQIYIKLIMVTSWEVDDRIWFSAFYMNV